MIKHYEKLNENTGNESNEISDRIKELELSTTSKVCLNKPFNIDEIKKGIQNLKSGKSSGPDLIMNEFLIFGKEVLYAPIFKLFNIILQSKCTPLNWMEGHVYLHIQKWRPKYP